MAEAALAIASRIPSNAKLFVNVLGSTLADKTFVRTELPKMLAGVGMSHERLILELSERQSLDHLGQFAEAREAIRSAGFSLCLDDVGTRNANLAEIAAFQPEWLKLDRSLVTGVDIQKVKRDLIHAIVEFGSRQNSKIVAEGIENQRELDLLKKLNVAYFQGFLLGRPKPLADAEMDAPQQAAS
jgi:EAL domain-containing protein (putative c-di-GMP-specific phosphodiesterase class I)